MTNLPAIRLSQHHATVAFREQTEIGRHVRIKSDVLTTHCRQAGLPMDLAEMCGGLLASVIDDLVTVGKLPKTAFERTKAKQRVLDATNDPQACALKLAMAASPTNGRAAVAHWDAICERHELGKLAWLLGMDTETAYTYGRRLEKRASQ